MTGPVKTARVMENRILAKDVHEVVLAPSDPEGEPFRAGQYLLLRTGKTAPRPFSIASSPGEPSRLTLCFRRQADGTATPILSSLAPGELVEYEGPAGAFRLDPLDRSRLFVATGTGISPLRSMILEHLEARDERPAWLIFGNRGPEDCLYHDFFRELESRHGQFRYFPCLSRPGDQPWDGEVGRVTDLIPRHLPRGEGWTVYICGREQMIADATLILAGRGVPRDRCRREP